MDKEKFSLLSNIKYPEDLRKLSIDELPELCRELREDIIEGRLAPGSKLRIEHLRTQYGIGAGTLREALTRLVSDALVSTEGQRGFSVTPIAMSDLEDITRLRVHIETDALRQSIRYGGAAWRSQLRASVSTPACSA